MSSADKEWELLSFQEASIESQCGTQIQAPQSVHSSEPYQDTALLSQPNTFTNTGTPHQQQEPETSTTQQPQEAEQEFGDATPTAQFRLPSSQSTATLGSSFAYEKVQTTVYAWVESNGASMELSGGSAGIEEEKQKALRSHLSTPLTQTHTSRSYTKVDKDHLSATEGSPDPHPASRPGSPLMAVTWEHDTCPNDACGRGINVQEQSVAVLDDGSPGDLEGLLLRLPPELRKRVQSVLKTFKFLGWTKVTLGCGVALLAALLLSSWQSNSNLRSSVRGRDAEMAKLLVKLFQAQSGPESFKEVAVVRHTLVHAS